MISIYQLEYIVALDKHRHFVDAADECFVTQPTLSMQIKKLENQLGVQIFDRSKQPVVPTSIGRQIIEQARKTLAESKKIINLIDEYQGKLEGEVNIGIIPSLAPYLLPLFIGQFTGKYPKLKVTIKELISEEIIEEIKKENLDFGLLVTPLKEKDIIENPLFYEKILFYVNNLHELASKKEISSKNITSSGMWMMSEGHCFRSQMVNLCSLKDEISNERGFRFESGSLETIKQFVEQEGGFTLLPEMALSSNPEHTKIIPIKNTPLREVALVHSKNFSKNKLIQVLIEEIQNSVPAEMLEADRGQKVEWR